jgi:ATP-binding cassette subfamily F protein 3
VAIVSHDRYFLDNLVNKVFELKDGAINEYHGNYTYFIEKRSQAVVPAGNEKPSQPLSGDQAFKTKEKKRLEAEERNKTYKARAALEKDLQAVETKISLLEAEKSGHETALCDPQTHRDSSKIKTINLELKKINAELENSYEIWTALHSKLEEITITNT